MRPGAGLVCRPACSLLLRCHCLLSLLCFPAQISDAEMTGPRRQGTAAGKAAGWTFCLSALQLGEQASYLRWDCERSDACASAPCPGASRRVESSSLPGASGPAYGLKLLFRTLQAPAGPKRFVQTICACCSPADLCCKPVTCFPRCSFGPSHGPWVVSALPHAASWPKQPLSSPAYRVCCRELPDQQTHPGCWLSRTQQLSLAWQRVQDGWFGGE